MLARAVAAVVLAGAAIAPAADAAEPDVRTPWAATVTLDRSAAQLGLRADASPSALAKAGAQRVAAKLGISESELGSLKVLPRQTNDPAGVAHLRQTVGGLRVLWSQVAVLAADGKVSSVSGTMMPLKDTRLAGKARVSSAEAVKIASARVKGPDSAGAAQLVAFAGDPDRPRAPRRAYVVPVDPSDSAGDNPAAKCVVIDAESGRVLAVWDGTVAPAEASPGAKAAAGSTGLAQYEDGKGRTSTSNSAIGSHIWDLHTNGQPFITYDTTGGFFVKTGSPVALEGILPGPPSFRMRAPMDGTTNVARFFCVNSTMFWCGRDGGRLGTGYHRWFFTVNWNGPVSQFRSSQERVYLKRGTQSFDEQVHAHEMGHVIDFFARDDFQQTFEGDEVQEALAEMFSFVYYRFRPAPDPAFCSISQKMTGNGCASLPHNYSQYSCTTTDEHDNGYILGAAFARIVNAIGFDDATRLLREVPRMLPAKRRFGSVHQAFEDATTFLGLGQHKQAVHDAFTAVGVGTGASRTGKCPGAVE